MRSLHPRVPLITLAACALALFLLSPAASAWIHVARSGETLDQLAVRYYGEVRFSMVIRAANGFMHPDDGRLLSGERVEIPEIAYHRVANGETWDGLADKYLGSQRRGVYLAELNGLDPETPPAMDRIVKIPYQLLYILAPDESAKSVIRSFMGEAYSLKWVNAYNLKKKKKWRRGDALLIPLIEVELTAEEKARIDKERGGPAGPSEEDRQAQLDAVAQIAELRDAFLDGRYVSIVATAQRLVGTGRLTVPQKIGVYKYLAFAYVAFDERALAVESFREALTLQPGMELSPITTSPKILDVFREAKDGLEKGEPSKEEVDGGK